MTNKQIRLNIGCGGQPLDGYINVDLDNLETLKTRYPSHVFPKGMQIYNYDIFNLPFSDDSVDEVRADSLIEHLSFQEEPLFFHEIKHILKPHGIFKFSIPDFEDAIKLWLAAKDDWKEFYRNDPEAIAQSHWFGTYSYNTENRWGYLVAMLFGNQNGEGQFHKNCYTIPKIRAILDYLNFEEMEISHYRWRVDRDLMIAVKAKKRPHES